jgi:galactose mutarotase-like enzyme
MTTCGLDHFGAPSEDMGLSFGLHGRVGNIPAEQVAHRAFWDGDDYVLEVSGQVRQSRLFGENMVLSRRIWTRLGADALHVEDTVTNEGFDTQPHMILYHCNLGFPLLNENAELDINAADTVPRDDEAKKGVDTWMQFQPPTDGYAEQVFRHAVVPDDDGMASAQLRSPDAGLALTVRYSVDTLPHLFQWKQMGKGAYVLGIEPANSSGIHGRAAARELDDLPHLEPGEQRHYRLSFEIATL